MTYQDRENHQVQQEYNSMNFDEENIHCYLRTDDWQNVLELILDIQHRILQIENYDFKSLEAEKLKNVKDACILLFTLNEYNKNQKFYLKKLNPRYEYNKEHEEEISKIIAFIEESNNTQDIAFSIYGLSNLYEDLKEEAYHTRYLESQYSKEMFSNIFDKIVKKDFLEKNRMTKWYWRLMYYIRDFFLKIFSTNQQTM